MTPPVTGQEPTLTWGVSAGFREYLEALPDSATTCTDGCTELQGQFLFLQWQSETSGSGEFRFAGTVHFAGHAGMLDVRIIEPEILMFDDGWVLTVTEPGGRPGAVARTPLVRLPDLTLACQGDYTHGTCESPELTFEGTYLFGNVYRTGYLMEPLQFTALHSNQPQAEPDIRSNS